MDRNSVPSVTQDKWVNFANLQLLNRKVKVTKQIYKITARIKSNSILEVVSMERIIESSK